MKIKKLYIDNKGKNLSDDKLISELKSLNTVYFTNNICESVHSKISNDLPKGQVTKTSFRDTLNYILNEYTYKIHNIIRRDYITRTLIIIVLKYNLNKTPQFVEFNQIKMKIEKTISLMTGNINQNFVKELFEGIDRINSDENKDINEEIISEKNINDENNSLIDENENKIESDENSFSEEENIIKDISIKDVLKANDFETNFSFDFEYSKNNISDNIELSDENNKKDEIDINKL